MLLMMMNMKSSEDVSFILKTNKIKIVSFTADFESSELNYLSLSPGILIELKNSEIYTH